MIFHFISWDCSSTYRGYTIPAFSSPRRPTQPGYPSVGRCNTVGDFVGGRNGDFCVAVGPVVLSQTGLFFSRSNLRRLKG